jgi:hypothetical protein
MNSVSIRNYGETLAIIKELKNLGVFKSSKSKKKRTQAPNDTKQESDLVGYAVDNIPNFTAVTPDMSQSQIEDIQRRQAVSFATLRDEVKQQRLEDIDALQGQRAGDITRFGSEMNRIITRLPDKPFDPFANLNPQIGEPDINENTFEGGINEGAPNTTTQLPTTTFAEEQIPEPRIQPREPIGGRGSSSKRAQKALDLGLEPPPKQKESTRADLDNYYKLLRTATSEPINANLNFNSKDALFREINRILDKN